MRSEAQAEQAHHEARDPGDRTDYLQAMREGKSQGGIVSRINIDKKKVTAPVLRQFRYAMSEVRDQFNAVVEETIDEYDARFNDRTAELAKLRLKIMKNDLCGWLLAHGVDGVMVAKFSQHVIDVPSLHQEWDLSDDGTVAPVSSIWSVNQNRKFYEDGLYEDAANKPT